jgi:hypothetical protein
MPEEPLKPGAEVFAIGGEATGIGGDVRGEHGGYAAGRDQFVSNIIVQASLQDVASLLRHPSALSHVVSADHVHGCERFIVQNAFCGGGIRPRSSADDLSGLAEE